MSNPGEKMPPRKLATDLDHPCRDTCSGWQQGYQRGQENLRAHYTAIIQEERARAMVEIECHYAQRLASLMYSESDDDGNALLLSAKEIERKIIAEMDRAIDAHMKNEAARSQGEGER